MIKQEFLYNIRLDTKMEARVLLNIFNMFNKKVSYARNSHTDHMQPCMQSVQKKCVNSTCTSK